jgi:FkbM family methyltransferase
MRKNNFTELARDLANLIGEEDEPTEEDWAQSGFSAVEEGLYKFLSTKHIRWILETYEVNCVLDVGANSGQYANSLREAGYNGHIVSFEPMPQAAAELSEAAEGDPHWSVYPMALGSISATLPFNAVPGTGSSLLTPSDFGRRRFHDLDHPDVIEVPVRRLDEVLDNVLTGIRDPRPYLKMDTQGCDVEVFAGAGTRVREFVAMQSEVSLMQIYDGMPRMQTALDTYEQAGFEITGMFPVSREVRTGRVIEFDCVLTRSSEGRHAAAASPFPQTVA